MYISQTAAGKPERTPLSELLWSLSEDKWFLLILYTKSRSFNLNEKDASAEASRNTHRLSRYFLGDMENRFWKIRWK